MSEYPIHHKIRVNYINEAKESDTREVPIYQIGINKKNFCKPFAAVENRNDGYKTSLSIVFQSWRGNDIG